MSFEVIAMVRLVRPWKARSKTTTPGRRVAARAILTAFSTASAPELTSSVFVSLFGLDARTLLLRRGQEDRKIASMAAAGATERRDALVERLFLNAVGAFDLFSVYLGERLGLYRALADRGALTSAELAEAAGIQERYAREWLEH